jgi:hypothetical protein
VLALAVWSEAKGRPSVQAFGRRIPATCSASPSRSSRGARRSSPVDHHDRPDHESAVEQVLFDVISGFATVGRRASRRPPDPAVYVLALTMFMGRVGTVTLAAAVAATSRSQHYSLPVERPIVG